MVTYVDELLLQLKHCRNQINHHPATVDTAFHPSQAGIIESLQQPLRQAQEAVPEPEPEPESEPEPEHEPSSESRKRNT
eukprot:SAG22_NODE_335_length_12071_cov_5.268771_2_plen_79_part_00